MTKTFRIFLVLILTFGIGHSQAITPSSLRKNKVDHGPWDTLLKKYVDDDGWVDYEGFSRDSVKLHAYLHNLTTSPPENHWTQSEKLAYYINMYNAYTVALILREYPIESIKDIQNPWSEKFIRVGEETYSLNNIEHGILRKMGEPRIHFAVNCASVSCPKLLNQAYVSEGLDVQLEQATKDFINGAENDLNSHEVALSRIFKWYRGDFEVEGKNNLMGFLNRYSEIPIERDAKISFKEYNWKLNEQQE